MKIALLGDTMLGRGVADRLRSSEHPRLFADDVLDVLAEADLVIANLECAISDRGERWPNSTKPYFFRAPPVAAELLAHAGVDCVSLANNHALDYGPVALLDTIELLTRAGITVVGAGADAQAARRAAVLHRDSTSVAVIGATDHPAEFAVTDHHPGVAYADLRDGLPDWLLAEVAGAVADIVIVSPHWGPNLVDEPVPHVRRAALGLRAAGATLVAGHSAHVVHGVSDRVLFDLGDVIDDYAVHPVLRNDLGLVFLASFDGGTPRRLEAVPIAIEHCSARLAHADEVELVAERFGAACAAFGTPVELHGQRLTIDWSGQLVA